jgi:hypothetical protein
MPPLVVERASICKKSTSLGFPFRLTEADAQLLRGAQEPNRGYWLAKVRGLAADLIGRVNRNNAPLLLSAEAAS